MSTHRKTEWVIDHRFDSKYCRHRTNGTTTVIHCHHYASLYAQLADDAEMVDGKSLLRKAAEFAFLPVLKDYFREHGVTELGDRIELAQDYFRLSGMGCFHFQHVGPISASVRMEHSHVDEGWIKKWGKRERPVNFIGQGYLAAVMSALYDLPAGSFFVRELESKVSGAPASVFHVVRI